MFSDWNENKKLDAPFSITPNDLAKKIILFEANNITHLADAAEKITERLKPMGITPRLNFKPSFDPTEPLDNYTSYPTPVTEQISMFIKWKEHVDDLLTESADVVDAMDEGSEKEAKIASWDAFLGWYVGMRIRIEDYIRVLKSLNTTMQHHSYLSKSIPMNLRDLMILNSTYPEWL